jgi:Endoplasmic Reticulum Oxidoreductin 1 (ERO1)
MKTSCLTKGMQVPAPIKAVDASEHGFELDGWARWDMPTEDYYDIAVFPEGYTGYDGREVWQFIHNKICFEGYQYDDDHWKADFNKAVSGLHSMISAQVNRGIQERVENGEAFTDDEVWRDPNAEFQRRLSPQGETPLALENLYFAYMLLLKAASKAKSHLLYDVQSGKISADAGYALQSILDDPLLNDESVGVAFKKLHHHAVMDTDSKAALWEARMRARELGRIMNCVQCNKCRLHGKVSIMGLSTALQILVGEDGEGGDINSLHRVELATLMATLHKFSTAVDFCQKKLNY